MTFRLVACGSLLCAFVFAGQARAQGQQAMGASTPLPLAVDLKKVPVGSWSEYRIADGKNNLSVRMALVARSGKAADVETQIKGGPVGALGQTIVRMSIPLETADVIHPREQVIQLGDNPPMLLPSDLGGASAQSFKKLDPKKRVGVESVTVPGGTFPHAEHYKDKGMGGEPIDFWISKDILPFGLIKVTSTAPGPGQPAGGAGVAMELTGHGAGAKRLITKAPQPFDAATIMKQAQMATPGATAGGGGPPPRPIPSPHPGMPPTTPGAAPAPAGAPPRNPPSSPVGPSGANQKPVPK